MGTQCVRGQEFVIRGADVFTGVRKSPNEELPTSWLRGGLDRRDG